MNDNISVDSIEGKKRGKGNQKLMPWERLAITIKII